MPNDLLYQIALTMIPTVGPVQAKILLEYFECSEDIFKAPKKELENIEGIGSIKAGVIKKFDDFRSAENEIEFISKYKIETLFIKDKDYPRRLLNCYDSPTLLYYRGNADLNASRIINIIGTRNHTDYGRQVAEQLIDELQSQQVIIVSGLAYGIDAIAHKAAVQNNLPTVGVLAHGLDTIYPAQHTGLAKQMALNGGLLTEFRKETKPDKHNFPRRNRIVAGMADATIVIETALKGGSMITAELANGYNRDVFAYPGKVTDSKSAGCNHLIKNNKAILLEGSEQLIETMGWSLKKTKRRQQTELFISLTSDEQILVDILKQKEAVHIDEIYLKSGLTSSTVAASMLNLEFQNLLASMPGKMYKLL
ncbi:DNA-processing protein DprA [Segetibacter aerophilus]|uniref:DNA processing protein DprA n=1 Tax=Segetibacter aerophilus TaxID=670293 RepID=A0A512BBC2_9BACT|nr:DNA-processing protein DprA [Segetibacter aerophilus]GEO09263.1 DNA processing protein DprA [Segetibacter aerophilus]